MPKQAPLNIIICGQSSIHQQHVWNAVSSPQLDIHICGYWDPKRVGAPEPFKDCNLLTDPFDELLRTKDADVILLCDSPQTQYGILMTALSGIEKSLGPRNRFPAVILLPPVSPCYNTTLLSDAKNLIGMAMPFRFLPVIHSLTSHLKSLTDNSPLNTVRNPSSLPSHWSLGTVRSINARLVATKTFQFERYSWLCESGSMGGGLLNLFGASLFDTLFLITLGLRIVSVTCVTRTFDTELWSDPKSIRRVSAEDYVVVIAELESRSSSHQQRLGIGGPVATLCLSADLSPTGKTTADASHPSDCFELRLELTGSSGRFLLPESGDRVCWTPVRSVKHNNTRSQSSLKPTGYCNGLVIDGSERLPPLTEEPSNDTMLDGVPTNSQPNVTSVSREEVVFLSPKYQKTTQVDGRGSDCSIPNTVTQENSSLPRVFSPTNEAWTRWFSHLSTTIATTPSVQAMHSLIAPPDHWGYIQRVLTAIDKASRMRCWVDVSTGEKL